MTFSVTCGFYSKRSLSSKFESCITPSERSCQFHPTFFSKSRNIASFAQVFESKVQLWVWTGFESTIEWLWDRTGCTGKCGPFCPFFHFRCKIHHSHCAHVRTGISKLSTKTRRRLIPFHSHILLTPSAAADEALHISFIR